MAIQNDNTLVTKGDLKSLYTDKIAPYLGGGISYYYTDRTGEELKSCFARLASNWKAASNTNLPLIAKSGNIIQLSAGLFTIPSGTRVEMIYSSSAHPMGDTIFEFYNNTDSEVISDLIYIDPYAEGGQSGYLNSQVLSVQWTNNTNHSVDIAVRCRRASGGTILLADLTSLTIKEIGRIVDPIKYVDNNSDLEETPVGNIISYMGNSVPKHYLACDGQTYPIGSYPELEAHFISEFGSVNYFGGDGTSTFAVPDLKGEFLRGTGTNSHANQGLGANVGIHQDATSIPLITAWSDTSIAVVSGNDSSFVNTSRDTDGGFARGGSGTIKLAKVNTTSAGTSASTNAYLTRPTNTSVQYCIKYESTYHAFFSNAAYKVSIAASVTASNAVQLVFDSSDIIGDSSLVSENSLVAPMDGWYSLGMNWSQSGSGDIGYYIRINGASGKGYNRGIFISDTLYLNKGDVITIWKESGSANSGRVNFCLLISNYNPTIVSADSVYSENEQMIGYWKDGKPLYQKTVGIGAESSAGMKTYTINIANTDLVMVDFSHSFQYRTSGTKEIIPISDEWDAGNTGGYLIQPSTNDFKFFWYRKIWNELPALITFQYTKTTDTATTLQIENSLLLNRPDLWEVGTEYHFGGGLYGQRFTGTYVGTLATGGQENISLGVTISKLVNSGGDVHGDSMHWLANQSWKTYYESGVWSNSSNVLHWSIINNSNTSKNINIAYDIWVTYKK